MEDLGKRLCDLIEHAVAAADPEASLRAVAALKDDLEAFERAQVSRWLRRGASFTVIAGALGISRQAAHRRYRDLTSEEAEAPEGRTPEGRSPEGRILITSEARAVVKAARQEASALGARAVGTEHLLLGILRVGDDLGAGALRDAGIDLGAARSNAQVTLVDGSLDGIPEGPKGISPQARAAFEESLHEAVRRGDGYIGVEHLLIATVRNEDGGAHRTLQALGVNPQQVLDQLRRSRVA